MVFRGEDMATRMKEPHQKENYHFFASHMKFLSLCIDWSKKDPQKWKKIPVTISILICIFYSIIFFTIAELISLKDSSKNLHDLIKNLNMSMSFILTTCKVTVFFFNRRKIINLVDILSSNCDLFEGFGSFRPLQIIREESNFSLRLTAVFFLMACAVPSTACIGSFYTIIFDFESKFIEVSIGNETRWIYGQKLPYYSWVPFDYTSSRGAFGVAVVYQCLALLFCGTITVGFDMLYTALVNSTSCHLRLLQGFMRTIRQRCARRLLRTSGKLDRGYLNREMNLEMNKSVRFLQTIFSVCQDLEDIFSYLILLQLLISLLVFCTCLYLVLSVPFNKLIMELTYLLAIEIQLAMYCYVGNNVTLRGDGIPNALYECGWLDADKTFKTSMIITMMRMKKPIRLTIGKFSSLTLNTFLTIERASYSLCAVIREF